MIQKEQEDCRVAESRSVKLKNNWNKRGKKHETSSNVDLGWTRCRQGGWSYLRVPWMSCHRNISFAHNLRTKPNSSNVNHTAQHNSSLMLISSATSKRVKPVTATCTKPECSGMVFWRVLSAVFFADFLIIAIPLWLYTKKYIVILKIWSRRCRQFRFKSQF